MTLLQAWGDSLSLLKPKNLKLFLLVTLKSIIEAYKLLFKYWWWLYVIIIGSLLVPYFIDVSLLTYIRLEKIFCWVYQVLLFATLVTTRPSAEQKNCNYFRRYIPYFLIVVPFLLVFPSHVWPSALSSIYIFFNLFYLDSPKRILIGKFISKLNGSDILMSFIRTLKMIIYNYPLLLCVGITLYAPLYIFCNSIYAPLLLNVIKIVLLPVPVCLYTNIYIKKLHDQFDLYFKQPS